MQFLLAQTTTDDASRAAVAAIAAATGTVLIAGLVVLAISVAIYFVILNKAGFNPWLSLLVLVPFVGHLIVILILVFGEWPVRRELAVLRAQFAGARSGVAPTYAGGYGLGSAQTLPPGGIPPANPS